MLYLVCALYRRASHLRELPMPERNQEDEHQHGDGAEDPHGEPVAQTIRETSQKDAAYLSELRDHEHDSDDAPSSGSRATAGCSSSKVT